MRNNTLNKIRVAATELYRSCCRRIQICILERRLHKIAVRLCAAVKLTEIIRPKWLEVEGARAELPHSWRRQ